MHSALRPLLAKLDDYADPILVAGSAAGSSAI